MNPTIVHALDVAGIPTPPAVADALDVLEAAERNLTAVKAEVAPDPAKVTAKTMTRHTAALAQWATHPERVSAAEQIHTSAVQAVNARWFESLADLAEQLREPFDVAARQFEAALADLDGNTTLPNAVRLDKLDTYRQLNAAADTLAALARARDELATLTGRAPITDRRLEQLGRVLHFPNGNGIHALATCYDRTRTIHPYGPEWWAQCLAVEGVSIRWTAASNEQQTSADITPKSGRPALPRRGRFVSTT